MSKFSKAAVVLTVSLTLLPCAFASADWKEVLRGEIDSQIAAQTFNDGAVAVVKGEAAPDFATFGKAKTDTIFEIGSVTKTFTAVVFAEFVLENRVAPDDLVQKYIPELTGTFAGGIKLRDLATHTSGLPKIPNDLPLNSNPYVSYNWAQLLTYLKSVKAPASGPVYPANYSNTGYALLGQILTTLEGGDYGSMVRNRVLRPLGTKDSNVKIGPERAARFIDGHSDHDSQVVPHWDFDAFAPAGAFRSTAQDMAHFVYESLNPDMTTLVGQAIKLSQENQWGWDSQFFSYPYLYKNGGTGGFRSSLMIDPANKIGFVILTNTAHETESLSELLRGALLAQ